MRFVRVVPGAEWLAGRRPFLHLLAEATEALGGRLEMEEAYGHVGRYHPPGEAGAPRPIFGNALGLNAEAAAMLAADKDYTARLLIAAGVPAPQGALVFSEGFIARMRLKNARVAEGLAGQSAAPGVAARLGYPVVVKPNSGSEGRALHIAADEDGLLRDLKVVLETDDKARVEKWLPGEDLRVTVLDGAARLAYRRQPPEVVGDGTRSVADLAQRLLDRLAQDHRGAKLSLSDPRVMRALAAQGVALSDILPEGWRLRLLDSANLSAGGGMSDLTRRLPQELERLALRATELVGLRFAGVDLRGMNLIDAPGAAHVLEVNAAPGLDYFASAGPAQWAVARALLEDALR